MLEPEPRHRVGVAPKGIAHHHGVPSLLCEGDVTQGQNGVRCPDQVRAVSPPLVGHRLRARGGDARLVV